MKLSRKYGILLNTIIFSILLIPQAALGNPPLEKSLLWEISGKDLKQPSYLYGTFHIACSDQIRFSDALKKAFNQSSQVYLEIDLDDSKVIRDSLSASSLKNGGNLKNYLSNKDYARANQFFQKNIFLPLDSLSTLKPILLSALIVPKLFNCQTSSWEDAFVKLAHTQRKDVLGLETVQAQFNAIDSIPPKVQAQQMMEMIDDLPGTKKELSVLINAYKSQDISRIRQLMSNSSGMKPEYEAAMIDNRNRSWIPNILNAAKTKPTFFGVGAGHLGGRYGVIALLRQSGYRVKPLGATPSPPQIQ